LKKPDTGCIIQFMKKYWRFLSLMSNLPSASPIQIGQRIIGPDQPPFIIAEMSGNHNQSLGQALAIVDAAAEAGVDALKIQTYTADTMTLNISEGEFFIADPNSLWQGSSLYSLYQQAHTPWEWHEPIFKRCQEHGLIGFTSPFDATAVDFLEAMPEELRVQVYKIASFEIVDLPLIAKVAATGKPMIISTGMATLDEINDAVTTAREAGCRDLILLKCTSSYPADPGDSHLRTIPYLQQQLGIQVGLSDHTLGIGAAIAAVTLGATVIEKHFTLRRADGGVDSAFSLEPLEMAALVRETRTAQRALGTVQVGPTDNERDMLRFRRSLYVAEDIAEGECFTERNLRAIRPGLGLSPKFYQQLLGQKASRAIRRGAPMSWDLVESASTPVS
jgi:N-acetylneuraminate synthase